MEALIWLAAGTLSGWAAGKLMKGRDYGVTGNIILGMLGSRAGAQRLAGDAQNPNHLARERRAIFRRSPHIALR